MLFYIMRIPVLNEVRFLWPMCDRIDGVPRLSQCIERFRLHELNSLTEQAGNPGSIEWSDQEYYYPSPPHMVNCSTSPLFGSSRNHLEKDCQTTQHGIEGSTGNLNILLVPWVFSGERSHWDGCALHKNAVLRSKTTCHFGVQLTD